MSSALDELVTCWAKMSFAIDHVKSRGKDELALDRSMITYLAKMNPATE